jgi:hypothetical protein
MAMKTYVIRYLVILKDFLARLFSAIKEFLQLDPL